MDRVWDILYPQIYIDTSNSTNDENTTTTTGTEMTLKSLLDWMQMTTHKHKLYNRLRSKDWNVLYHACCQTLSHHNCSITTTTLQWYPGIVQQLFHISILHQLQHDETVEDEEEMDDDYDDDDEIRTTNNVVTISYHQRKWHQLIVQLFFNMKHIIMLQQQDSSCTKETAVTMTLIYHAMEQTIFTGLSSLSTNHMIPSNQHTLFLQQWMKCIVASVEECDIGPVVDTTTTDHESIPSEMRYQKEIIIAELLILIWQVAAKQQSESFQFLSDLISDAFMTVHPNTKSSHQRTPTQPKQPFRVTNIATLPEQVQTECWDFLLQVMVPNDFWRVFDYLGLMRNNVHFGITPHATIVPSNDDDDDHSPRQDCHSTCSVAAIVERIFNDVVYMGHGQFVEDPNSHTNATTTLESCVITSIAESLSMISRRVRKCLMVTNDTEQLSHHQFESEMYDSRNKKNPISERVHHWIQCVCHIANGLYKTDESEEKAVGHYMDGIVAVVVLVTIFVEVPIARTYLAQTILEMLSQCTTTASDYKGHATRVIYTTAITVILSSSSSNDVQPPQPHSELEIISYLLTQPIPSVCFCDIARAIFPLPSARSILLSTRPKDYTRPDHEAVRCRLYSLMLLIQRSRWNHYDIEAWRVFSDILVDNGLDLPIMVRVWMLQELKDAVRNMKFHRDVITKLLRAGIARIIHFLVHTVERPETSSFKKRTKRNEKPDEVIGLFDLVFTLIHCGSAGETSRDVSGDSSCMILKRCLHLLPTLLDLRQYQTNVLNDDSTCISNSVPTLSKHPVDSKFLCVAAFCCLAVAFDRNGDKSFVFDGISLPPLNEIRKMLVEAERMDLSEYFSSDTLPIWVRACETCETLGEPKTYPGAFKHLSKLIQSSLCDIVALLFIGPRSWQNDFIYLGGTDSNWLAFQIPPLLCLKHRISDSIDDKEESKLYAGLEMGSQMVSFICLCTIVVPTMKVNIVSRTNFQQTNEMLSATLDFCECSAVKHGKASTATSMTQYLKCFRNIYSAVIQEESAVALICYLETCCRSGKLVLHNASMERPDDITCFVRRLRTSFFQSLSCRLADIRGIQLINIDTHILNKAGMKNSCPLELFITYIVEIAKDLSVGLSGGKSGGLTHDVYMSMIETVEKCSQLASYSLTSDCFLQNRRVSSLAANIYSASIFFEEILCNFAIHQAVAFKKTLMLCTASLPSIIRLIRCNDFSVIDEYNAETASSARRIFDQLVCILRRKYEYMHLESITWEVIAGKDHIGGRQHFSESDDDVSELSDGFTDVVVKCERDSTTIEQSLCLTSKILLRSERSWTWSLCCIIDAFKQDWLDSCIFMTNCSSFGLETNLELYFEIRQEELKESLEGVCHIFQTSMGNNATRAHRHPLPINPDYVVHLPTPAKLKLFSMVETIVSMLKKSIKILLTAVHSISDGKGRYLQIRSNMEAFICLYTWLNLCTDRSELCCGLKRWQLTEKSLSSTIRDENEKSVDRSSLLRQFPNIIYRCEEVENLLQKLSHAVRATKKKRENDGKVNHRFIAEINDMISNLIGDSLRFDVLLSRKVAYLEKEHSVLRNEFGLLETDNDLKGKKRKHADTIAKVVRRERRRRILRSRNSVVDKWLQSDKVTGEEESIDDDAYADLEDFLVDG